MLDSLLAYLQSPQGLNTAGTALDAGGQMIGALSHLQFGQQANQAAQYEAAQLRQQAGQAVAGATRQAFDVDRQAKLVSSQALAVAAASGGGATDPTVVTNISRIAQEGAYRSAVALYQGQDRARLMQMQAEAKEYQGAITEANSRQVAAAQFLGAGTTLMKGMAKGASLFQKYGANSPASSGAGETGVGPTSVPANANWGPGIF